MTRCESVDGSVGPNLSSPTTEVGDGLSPGLPYVDLLLAFPVRAGVETVQG